METVGAGREGRVSVRGGRHPVRNAPLRIHAIKPRTRTIGTAQQVHQRPLVQQDRITHASGVRRDPLRRPARRTDAPDVQFVRKQTLDEVDEFAVGGPQWKVSVLPGRRSGEIGRAPDRVRPADTNNGSPGPGV